MISIVFRDRVESPYPIAGKGTLNIPEGEEIAQYVGHQLTFTVTADYADIPLGPPSKGVLAKAGTTRYYEFEITKINTDGKSGSLLILSEARGRSE